MTNIFVLKPDFEHKFSNYELNPVGPYLKFALKMAFLEVAPGNLVNVNHNSRRSVALV